MNTLSQPSGLRRVLRENQGELPGQGAGSLKPYHTWLSSMSTLWFTSWRSGNPCLIVEDVSMMSMVCKSSVWAHSLNSPIFSPAPIPSQKVSRRMSDPLGALLPVLMVHGMLTDADSRRSPAVAITAEPSSIALDRRTLSRSLPPQGTPVTATATATPTPASVWKRLPQCRPKSRHGCTHRGRLLWRSPSPNLSVPESSRSQWNHWTDEDGDCQDARQEALISESLVGVTFESEREAECPTLGRVRVAVVRFASHWHLRRGAFGKTL